MPPAGVIWDVDLDSQTVSVNRTQDEIKEAPEYDDRQANFDEYRNRLGGHYGPGAGYRDRERTAHELAGEESERAEVVRHPPPSSVFITRRAVPCRCSSARTCWRRVVPLQKPPTDASVKPALFTFAHRTPFAFLGSVGRWPSFLSF